MLKEKTKIIEVNQKKYRLTKLDARSGSYLAFKIVAAAVPALGNNSAKTKEALGNTSAMTKEALASIVTSMSRKEFDELQTMLLVKVQKLVGSEDTPMPIMKPNGVFVDEELEYDVATVINLTVSCIMFNIGGFFNEAGLMTNPAE